ncbi:MAG: hypothetical protein ACRDWV_11225 [Acidimicrobiales bacterium]
MSSASSPDDLAAHLGQLRQELADAPPEVVIANHGYGLFELAALHLALDPPRIGAARLATEGLASLLEGLKGRLGADELSLRDNLSQLRLALAKLDPELSTSS